MSNPTWDQYPCYFCGYPRHQHDPATGKCPPGFARPLELNRPASEWAACRSSFCCHGNHPQCRFPDEQISESAEYRAGKIMGFLTEFGAVDIGGAASQHALRTIAAHITEAENVARAEALESAKQASARLRAALDQQDISPADRAQHVYDTTIARRLASFDARFPNEESPTIKAEIIRHIQTEIADALNAAELKRFWNFASTTPFDMSWIEALSKKAGNE